MKPTTDEIVEQAQVFASTYSLVGGPLDDGSKFAQSEDEKGILREMIASALTAAPASAGHPDDIAVDQFAEAMKAKLAKKRADGRGGWEDRDRCSAEFLSTLLRGHVEKGDPVDVANLAMMLHQRGETIAPAIGVDAVAGAALDYYEEEVKELKTQSVELRSALHDLLTWFPDRPSPPEWRLRGGTQGADDAVEHARNLIAFTIDS
jgi:hypothetical protein